MGDIQATVVKSDRVFTIYLSNLCYFLAFFFLKFGYKILFGRHRITTRHEMVHAIV